MSPFPLVGVKVAAQHRLRLCPPIPPTFCWGKPEVVIEKNSGLFPRTSCDDETVHRPCRPAWQPLATRDVASATEGLNFSFYLNLSSHVWDSPAAARHLLSAAGCLGQV